MLVYSMNRFCHFQSPPVMYYNKFRKLCLNYIKISFNSPASMTPDAHYLHPLTLALFLCIYPLHTDIGDGNSTPLADYTGSGQFLEFPEASFLLCDFLQPYQPLAQTSKAPEYMDVTDLQRLSLHQ